MYSENIIIQSVQEYFSNAEKSADIMQGVAADIKYILCSDDVDNVINKMREFRCLFQFEEKSADKKYNNFEMPAWYRMLVFEFVFNYLKSNYKIKGSFTQSELLKAMGLSPDIFTKHWKISSPDFVVKQVMTPNFPLVFNHAQVESNAVYRGMIKHLLTCAGNGKNSLVEVFAKYGIIAMTCGGAFASRTAYLSNIGYESDGLYKIMSIIKEALNKPTKVYKELEELQRKIEIIYKDYNSVEIDNVTYNDLSDVCSYLAGYIGFAYNSETNIYKYCARWIVYNIIRPAYWDEDKIYKKEDRLLDMNVSRKQVKYVLDISIDDVKVISALIKNVNYEVQDKVFDIVDNLSSKDILVVDLPHYGLEAERYKFGYASIEYFIREKIANITQDFVIAFNSRNHTKLESVSASVEQIQKVREYMTILFEELDYNAEKQLYVYQYKPRAKDALSSIALITTIDFLELSEDIFENLYGVKVDGKLLKKTFRKYIDDYKAYKISKRV